VTGGPGADLVREAARARFARQLTGGTGDPAELEAWLREDPARGRAYADVEQAWRRAGELADDVDVQAWTAAALRGARPVRRTPGWTWLAAASLAVAVVAGYLLRDALWPPTVVHATVLGQQRSIALADGSVVMLNTDSRVSVRYGLRSRRLVLQRGEALFDVAHDVSRPFTVEAGDGTVTALGTRFGVRNAPDAVTVTLAQGRVQVQRPHAQMRVLRPDEQALLPATGGGIALQSVDAATALGWTEGWLKFRRTPLAAVIAEANRYSAQPLSLGDPALADVPLSGSFRVGDNASIAAAAELIMPVRAQTRGDGIVLLPR